jgi:hypothetical protein
MIRRRLIVPTMLFFALVAGGAAQQSTSQRNTAKPSTSSLAQHPAVASAAPVSRVGLRSQPSFWDDSLKMIRDGGWDIGSWLAYRRRLLVEASLTNRYFWFCITSYAANVVLIYLFYASRVSEERKIWKATEVMTDLWNWALYADWTARKAINKYNTHIDRCHSQENARSASNAATSREASEVARFQAERDTLQQELIAVKNELAERDRVITNLNVRIDEVSKSITGGSDPKLTADLMSKVNILTARNQHLEEQLTSAQNKLKQFAQGPA